MGYYYSLSISDFQTADNNAVLAQIREASPDMAEEMDIINDSIVFDPCEPYQKWCNEEDKVIPLIIDNILPGTYCQLDWEGEDGERGGLIISNSKTLNISYVAVCNVNGKEVPLSDAIALLTGASAAGYTSTWNYHEHGEHKNFPLRDWSYEVSNKDTVLGYQDWVDHQLESLFDDASDEMNGEADLIEVSGADDNGHTLENATYFFVSQHIPGEGAINIADFNTKELAMEFAKALSARTGLQIVEA